MSLMKVGQIFDLPTEYDYPLGHIGKIRDKETEKKLVAKYQVIEVEGEKKGRVIVTYGNKRRSNEMSHHRRVVPAGQVSDADKAG